MYSPMDDAGFPVKAEEFVVLSQEPSVSETIAPKIARPFIEVGTGGAPPPALSQSLPAPPCPSRPPHPPGGWVCGEEDSLPLPFSNISCSVTESDLGVW